jgi:hypothetical protein
MVHGQIATNMEKILRKIRVNVKVFVDCWTSLIQLHGIKSGFLKKDIELEIDELNKEWDGMVFSSNTISPSHIVKDVHRVCMYVSH